MLFIFENQILQVQSMLKLQMHCIKLTPTAKNLYKRTNFPYPAFLEIVVLSSYVSYARKQPVPAQKNLGLPLKVHT